jgi:hypothetical protein
MKFIKKNWIDIKFLSSDEKFISSQIKLLLFFHSVYDIEI